MRDHGAGRRHRRRQPAGRSRARCARSTVKFSEAVVAFGDRASPIRSPSRCQGATPGRRRPLGERPGLALRLPRGAAAGHEVQRASCAEWKPSAAARVAGRSAALTGPSEFSFSTGGPAIVSMQPGDGAEIEEDQHFLIRLNGPAVEASVLANAWCEVEGHRRAAAARALVGGELRGAVAEGAPHRAGAVAARMLIARCDRPLPHTPPRSGWSGARASPPRPIRRS